MKEILALLICGAAAPWLKKKRWIVVFEKFCKTAQDNSLYFFRYCMENLPENEKKRVFYIIDKRMPDFGCIKEYGSRIVQFMSIKHMVICMMMAI